MDDGDVTEDHGDVFEDHRQEQIDESDQEPMTRSLQLYCVRVTAFSQTDLFLD